MRVETLGEAAVLVVEGDGPVLTPASLLDAMAAAFEGGARTLAVAVSRLDPAFFDLRSGAAGEMVQTLANYRLRLAVVGELPAHALGSRSFSGFVLEGNRGDGPWFVGSLADLAERLTAAG